MMEAQNSVPPRFAERLLGWVCKKDLVDEILGDLHEYYKETSAKPRWKRTVIYWFHVVHFLRPFALRNLGGDYKLNRYGILRSYYKTSVRNLLKNPLSALINVFGLTAAISICIAAYVFLDWESSRDQFHKNRKELYLVTSFADIEGQSQQYGTSPTPLADAIKEGIEGVKHVCRLKDQQVILKNNEKVFHENVRYVDTEFLELFTFPLKWGTPQSLDEPTNIILSEEMSIKYFGYENPVGQSLSLIFNPDSKRTFQVSGVAEAFPNARAIDFDFLINFQNLNSTHSGYDLTNWESRVEATFIHVPQPSQVRSVEHDLNRFVKPHNDLSSARSISSFSLVPLTELHHRSGDIIGDVSFEFPPQKWVLPLLGLLLLLVACLNYTNISIASAAKRLKEIGLRKSIGASKGQIVFQFFAENLIITFLALSIGVLLSAIILIPWLNQAFDLELSFGTSFTTSPMWIYVLLILLFSSFISGFYPALYIARFKITSIFSGSVQFGAKSPLTKTFLGLQLVLSCICLACGIAVYQNVDHIDDRGWGYNQSETIYMRVPDKSTIDNFRNAVTQDPNVLRQAWSEHHLGTSSGSAQVHQGGHKYEASLLSVDTSYLTTMGLHLSSGRFFDDGKDKHTIVVNELLVERLKLDQPIGQQLTIDGGSYEVIGVVKDFHLYNFDYEIRPSLFRLADPENYHYLSVRVVNGEKEDVLKLLQEQWVEHYPELPFTGGLQQEVFSDYNVGAVHGAQFILFVALIAITLICLGLYGLLSFNVATRVKEFSVRKVLGARRTDVATAIAKPYTFLFAIALTIGIPTSYLISSSFLDSLYRYYDPISFFEVSLSALTIVLVSLSVIVVQIRKISRRNPVEGLKVE